MENRKYIQCFIPFQDRCENHIFFKVVKMNGKNCFKQQLKSSKPVLKNMDYTLTHEFFIICVVFNSLHCTT